MEPRRHPKGSQMKSKRPFWGGGAWVGGWVGESGVAILVKLFAFVGHPFHRKSKYILSENVVFAVGEKKRQDILNRRNDRF